MVQLCQEREIKLGVSSSSSSLQPVSSLAIAIASWLAELFFSGYFCYSWVKSVSRPMCHSVGNKASFYLLAAAAAKLFVRLEIQREEERKFLTFRKSTKKYPENLSSSISMLFWPVKSPSRFPRRVRKQIILRRYIFFQIPDHQSKFSMTAATRPLRNV